MPSASAKLEKQASTEVCEPIKQGITIIDHKIRNLEKRKLRLEGYRDKQLNGKELNSDQISAVAKYDEVQQTLEFARELSKQFNNIANEAAKQQKKQSRKDAVEKSQQELAKVKEILLIQDILANMGQDTIREDFLAGRNGAIKLTEEDLQHLDDLFTQVSPKREAEEGCPQFSEQVQKAAEHLLCLVEGKSKAVIGTTYAQLRQKIQEIHTCGYFESGSAVPPAPEGAAAEIVCEEDDVEGEEDPVSVPTATFQSSKPMVQPPIQIQPQQIISDAGDQNSLIIIPPQPQVNEVISSVMSVANSSFHFLQDSELDLPDVTPTAPPPSALPIPTQTFTNQSYVPTPQNYSQPQQQPPPQPVVQQQPQPVYTQMPISGQQAAYAPFTTSAPPQHQHQHQQVYQQQQTQQQPQPQPQPQPQVERVANWSDATSGNVIDNSDWNAQCEAASVSSENAWQQPKHHHQQSNSWGNDNSQHANDGFMPARSSSGRGGRGRGGRGGPRGGGGRSGSGGSSGGNYYNRNNINDNGGNNYYQSNGFQNRNTGSTDNRRGGAGGPRVGPGGPRSDRGGPRGGSRGGRGGNRQ